MSGFCPDDWHGTTDADLQQMAMGEDYDFWSDVARSEVRSRQVRRSPMLARLPVVRPPCAACGGEGFVNVLRKDGDTEAWPCRCTEQPS